MRWSSQRAAPRKSYRLPSRYWEISVGAPSAKIMSPTAAESSHRGRSPVLDPDESIQEDTVPMKRTGMVGTR